MKDHRLHECACSPNNATRMGANAMKIIRDLAIFHPAFLRRSTNVASNVCVIVIIELLSSRKRNGSRIDDHD
jgi:hypothetical protein